MLLNESPTLMRELVKVNSSDQTFSLNSLPTNTNLFLLRGQPAVDLFRALAGRGTDFGNVFEPIATDIISDIEGVTATDNNDAAGAAETVFADIFIKNDDKQELDVNGKIVYTIGDEYISAKATSSTKEFTGKNEASNKKSIPFASRCPPATDHFNIDARLPMLIVLCCLFVC